MRLCQAARSCARWEARNSQVELTEGAAGGGDSFKRRRHIDRAGVNLGLDTYSPF